MSSPDNQGHLNIDGQNDPKTPVAKSKGRSKGKGKAKAANKPAGPSVPAISVDRRMLWTGPPYPAPYPPKPAPVGFKAPTLMPSVMPNEAIYRIWNNHAVVASGGWPSRPAFGKEGFWSDGT
jgi:hypothetical protein